MTRLLILSVFVFACSTPSAQTAKEQPASKPAIPAQRVVVNSIIEAQAALGKIVQLKGHAVRAKLGVMIRGEHFNAYCQGAELTDKSPKGVVTAQGLLTQTKQFQAKTGANGEISQGTEGAVWILKDCTLSLSVK